MAEYDNTDTGALFRNRKKEPGDTAKPDYTGKINVGGTEYWLSAWINESKQGEKYMKLKVNPKDEAQQTASRSDDDFLGDDAF